MTNYETSMVKYIVEWIWLIIRIALFFLLWNQFVPIIGKKYETKKEFHALIIVLILTESILWYVGIDGFSFGIIGLCGIILLYVILRKKEYLKETIFSILLYTNFRYLAYFIVNTIISAVTKKAMGDIGLAENINSFIYVRIKILYNLTFSLYTIVLALEIIPVKKIIRKYERMSWNECGYLSILNIAGIILTRIMIGLAVVDTGNTKFVLSEEKPMLLLQMPVIAILLYLGEMAAIYIWQQYNYQRQRSEMYFVERMEKEAIHQRLIDTEKYYGRIRKVRHEMASHMTNIKGLAEQGKQEELSQYITNLDETIRSVEMKYATGNPVTDVVINDRYQKANEIGVVCSISFAYDESWEIPVYDISIILSNILDNAIKASSETEDELRFVSLKTIDRRNVILIQCENGYDMTVQKEKHPDDEWHGIGLKNVEDIADRFDGAVNIKKDGKIYSITVMLKKNDLL